MSTPVSTPVTTARRRRAARKAILGLLGVLGFLATWQLIPMMGIIDERFLPSAYRIGH